MYKFSLSVAIVLAAFFAGAFSTVYETPLTSYFQDLKSSIYALNHQLSGGDAELLEEERVFAQQELTFEISDVPVDRQHIVFLGGKDFKFDGCPDQGCLAWIQDRRGNILHTWPNNERAIPDLDRHEKGLIPPSLRPVSAKVLENGNLLVNYQVANSYPYAGGMALFDRDGEIVWSKYNWNHHWLNVSGDRIYSPRMSLSPGKLKIPGYRQEIVCDEDVLVDSLAEYDMDGELIQEMDLVSKLAENDWLGILFRSDIDKWFQPEVRNKFCDPTHFNFIEIVPPDSTGSTIQPGDFILSLRSNSALILMDSDLDTIKRVIVGRSIYQHSPRYYKDDKIIVFDNQGGASEPNISRLLEIDMSSMERRVIYPGVDIVDEANFRSTVGGYVGMNASRTHALAVITTSGRVQEIDLTTGEKTWEYCHKIDENRCKSTSISFADYLDSSIVELFLESGDRTHASTSRLE